MATDARISQAPVEVTLDESVTPAARVTHAPIEVAIDEPVIPSAQITQAFIEVAINVDAQPPVETSDTDVYSSVDLDDPPSYYGGFKEGRVKSFGTATRTLSDLTGQWSANDLTASVIDTDRTVRNRIANARKTRGTEVIIRMISDAERRLQLTPYVVFRGRLATYKPSGDLLVELQFNDAVGVKLASRGKDRMMPSRTITALDFPGAPTETIGKPVPIIYGYNGYNTGACPLLYVGVQDVGITGGAKHTWLVCGHAVKVITDLHLDDVRIGSGFGTTWFVPWNATETASPPPYDTGYLSENWNLTTSYKDINGRRYTLIQGTGADPDAVAAGTKRLTANVQGIETLGDGTGNLLVQSFLQYLHFFRNYVLDDYQGGLWPTTPIEWEPGWCQIHAQSFADAQEITKQYVTGGFTTVPGYWSNTYTALTQSGNSPPTRNQCFHNSGSGDGFTVYRWIQVTAIDSSGKETVCSNMGDVHGDQDPGNIYSFVTWDTPAGDVASYRVYVTNVLSYNDGFPTFKPWDPVPADAYWLDDNDHEPKIYYSTKDATENGGTWPPDNNHDHELLVKNETSGTRYVVPTWNPETSTPIATDGYETRAYIGPEQRSIRDWLATWNRSLNCRIGLNKYYQWYVTLLPATLTPADQDELELFTDGEDVHRGTLTIDALQDEFITRLDASAYKLPRESSVYLSTETYADLTAEEDADEMIAGSLALDFHDWNETSTSLTLFAEDVARRYLTQRSIGVMYRVTFQTDLCALDRLDIGQIFRLTHFAGVGATGWTNRLIQCETIATNIDGRSVTVGGLDVTDLYTLTHEITGQTPNNTLAAPTGASGSLINYTLGSVYNGESETTQYYKVVAVFDNGEESKPAIVGPFVTSAEGELSGRAIIVQWDPYPTAAQTNALGQSVTPVSFRIYRASDQNFTTNVVKADCTKYPLPEVPGNFRAINQGGSGTTYYYGIRQYYYLVGAGGMETENVESGDPANVLCDWWEDAAVDALRMPGVFDQIFYGRSDSGYGTVIEYGQFGWALDDERYPEVSPDDYTVTPGVDIPLSATNATGQAVRPNFYDRWPGQQDTTNNPWVSV